ncbi:MAG TPA: 1-acyl-sn-glycerol-3-phosphate acyltransferase, partial [Isosphaeraceae bacterium]|nr:1-acyl-sn-glycerol-3-phosphate acyltransferase [Isosphaeraceae bacterium]
MSEVPTFRPAKPWEWVIRAVQIFVRFDLFWRNRIHLEPRDLEVLRDLPAGVGIILAANHADETDLKVCWELSRRCGRRFLFMMNREAFAEGFGVAGWWLQRLGAFSVERGGENAEAKRYAIEIVERGQEVLVIFPEGEIYYLNDLVQPFKSGVVDIGMQAVIETRRTQPDWTAYLVPLALKYRYRQPIGPLLERRIRRMERHLCRCRDGAALPARLARIVAELLHRQELAHHLKPGSDRLAELSERVQEVRREVLAQVEEKYAGATANPQASTMMDRAWRLSSYLRNLLIQVRQLSATSREQFSKDLAELQRVAQMGSWQPRYLDVDPSQERLAETVLKMEREVYGIKRPHQLARRDVFLRIGGPIDLGHFAPAYLQDAGAVRHKVAEQLRGGIQALVNTIASGTVATTENQGDGRDDEPPEQGRGGGEGRERTPAGTTERLPSAPVESVHSPRSGESGGPARERRPETNVLGGGTDPVGADRQQRQVVVAGSGSHGSRTSGRWIFKVIACFEAALRVFTEPRFPDDWAMTQNNLGYVYRMLPTGDRAENFRRAITCFEASLRVYTQAEFPNEWRRLSTTSR